MLHELDIAHNDLRPENILINRDKINKQKLIIKMSLSF